MVASTTQGATRSYALTTEEVANYHTHGFLQSGTTLSPQVLAGARLGLTELLNQNQGVLPEQLVSAHLTEGQEGASISGARAFADLIREPALLDMAEAVLGVRDIICWGCQVFCKLPGEGRSIPFHQDGQYWPIEPLETTTLWVALDASDQENGGVRFIPGSHVGGYLRHVEVANDETAAISYILDPALLEQFPDSLPMDLPPGGVSLHHPAIVHGSDVNRSTRRRAGVAIHYMPSRCEFRRDVRTMGEEFGGLKLDFADRPLVLVRGENKNPRNVNVMTL